MTVGDRALASAIICPERCTWLVPPREAVVALEAGPMETVTGEDSASDPTGEMARNPAASQEVESVSGSVEDPAGISAEMEEGDEGLKARVVLRCWEPPLIKDCQPRWP